MSRKKILPLQYFLSKFSEINLMKSGGGGPSNDISAPRAVAYFKRCIEVHANVIATMSLLESSY
jgi:hypothetical protein